MKWVLESLVFSYLTRKSARKSINLGLFPIEMYYLNFLGCQRYIDYICHLITTKESPEFLLITYHMINCSLLHFCTYVLSFPMHCIIGTKGMWSKLIYCSYIYVLKMQLLKHKMICAFYNLYSGLFICRVYNKNFWNAHTIHKSKHNGN